MAIIRTARRSVTRLGFRVFPAYLKNCTRLQEEGPDTQYFFVLNLDEQISWNRQGKGTVPAKRSSLSQVTCKICLKYSIVPPYELTDFLLIYSEPDDKRDGG
jgi:hypothetical protein